MTILQLPKQLSSNPPIPGRKPLGGDFEIDRSNPLSRGISLCYVPGKSPAPVNVLGNIQETVSNKPEHVISRGKFVANHGENIAFTISNPSAIDFVQAAKYISNEITIVFKSRPNNQADDNGDYFSALLGTFLSTRTGSNQGLTYNQSGATGGAPNPGRQRFTIQGIAEYTSPSFNLNGADYQLHGLSAVSSGDLRFYTDGILRDTIAIGGFTTGSENCLLGALGPASSPIPGTFLYSSVEFVYVFNRALSDGEWASLNRDPYQILKPKTPAIYFPTTAAGPAEVSKDLTITWNILQELNKDTTLLWSILNSVAKTNTTVWNVLQEVSKDNTLSWSLLAELAKDSTFVWDVLSALTAVTKDVTVQWSLLSELAKDSNLRWNILEFLVKDTQVSWDLLELISKDSSFLYNLLEEIPKDSSFLYNLLEEIPKDSSFLWDLLSTLGSVSKDLTLNWDLLSELNKDSTLLWNTKQEVFSDTTIRWNLLNTVLQDLNTVWNINNEVPKDINLRWDMVSESQSDLTLRWNIQSDSTFPDITGTITIDKLTGVSSIVSLTPKITVR